MIFFGDIVYYNLNNNYNNGLSMYAGATESKISNNNQ